ncbi:MAG: AbrB/MazE/SpoVT family DNA-binding domain-containing protein [Thermoplasmatales archaeon]|nr:AbrB/MazE/SpoVT family DNA-binding domain-containing protein [Thermoplasmatales archaeon]
MKVAITKMSSKGQIVIPSNMREGIHIGEEFLIIKERGRIIIKKITDLAENLRSDIIFAQRVDKAWKDYEKGRFRKATKKDFLELLEKC